MALYLGVHPGPGVSVACIQRVSQNRVRRISVRPETGITSRRSRRSYPSPPQHGFGQWDVKFSRFRRRIDDSFQQTKAVL